MDLWQTNISVFRLINNLGKEFTYLNPMFIFIAEYMVFFLALTIILYWLKSENNRTMIISAGFSFILAEILGKLAGKFHSNINPFAELSNVNKLIEKAVNNSFPSDHTILFFSFCFTFFLFKKQGKFLWILLAALVAISRIWVGVHYPADVLVGAIISIVSSIIVFLIVPKSSIVKIILKIYDRVVHFFAPSKSNSKEM